MNRDRLSSFIQNDGGSDLEKVFSKEELSKFDGLHGSKEPLYLAILGLVFDVTQGAKHYQPDASYHAFTGRDGSKAFITGDFTEDGLTDDISDLDKDDLMSLFDWTKMYEKNYIFKGVVEGRFYSSDGKPTLFLKDIQNKIREVEDEKKLSKQYEQKYPPCNVEWTQEEGSRVWCSTKSGGVVRNWVGVPRKYYEPGASTYRCACINFREGQNDESVRHGMVEMYKECPAKSQSCRVMET
ncbi:hypothetical protein AAG570_000565 [Ranatra chinensis]|uniref:Cytochrome b5 heme-binding domain-containing protein n=1 Tax=Ranatra chinensis TaxID=642074 RepID=A0ABD0YXQ4_9HEMI